MSSFLRSMLPLRISWLVVALVSQSTNAVFKKSGNGRCLYDEQFVGGIQLRLEQYPFDTAFQMCRDYCSGAGEACWGITWMHCRRTCTLHGMGGMLFGSVSKFNPLMEESTVDECAITPTKVSSDFEAIGGSNIGEQPPSVMTSDGTCDAICMIHTYDCVVENNNHDVYVTSQGRQLKLVVANATVPPGSLINADCPAGYQGSLDLLCHLGKLVLPPGVNGQRKCNTDCPAGTIQALKSSVVVAVPPIQHAHYADIKCPEGYGGPLRIRCYDGVYQYTDKRCGNDCSAGSLLVNGAIMEYASMANQLELDVECPAPYFGTIRISCNDAVVDVLSGTCLLNCPVGTVNNVTGLVIPGSAPTRVHPTGLKYSYLFEREMIEELDFDVVADFVHNELRVANCPGQYSGTFEVECYHGTLAIVTLGTPCAAHCNDLRPFKAGLFLNALPNKAGVNGTNYNFPCDGTDTTVDTTCLNGRFIPLGACRKNCFPQLVYYEGEALNYTDTTVHGTVTKYNCPIGFNGLIEILCDDGWARVITRQCGENCPPAQIPIGNNVIISFGSTLHGDIVQVPCPPDRAGEVTIECIDGTPTYTSGVCIATTTTTTTTARLSACHNMTISLAYNETQYDYVANYSDGTHVLVAEIDFLNDTETRTVTCPPGFGGPIEVMCDAWGTIEWAHFGMPQYQDRLTQHISYPQWSSSEQEMDYYFDYLWKEWNKTQFLHQQQRMQKSFGTSGASSAEADTGDPPLPVLDPSGLPTIFSLMSTIKAPGPPKGTPNPLETVPGSPVFPPGGGPWAERWDGEDDKPKPADPMLAAFGTGLPRRAQEASAGVASINSGTEPVAKTSLAERITRRAYSRSRRAFSEGDAFLPSGDGSGTSISPQSLSALSNMPPPDSPSWSTIFSDYEMHSPGYKVEPLGTPAMYTFQAPFISRRNRFAKIDEKPKSDAQGSLKNDKSFVGNAPASWNHLLDGISPRHLSKSGSAGASVQQQHGLGVEHMHYIEHSNNVPKIDYEEYRNRRNRGGGRNADQQGVTAAQSQYDTFENIEQYGAKDAISYPDASSYPSDPKDENIYAKVDADPRQLKHGAPLPFGSSTLSPEEETRHMFGTPTYTDDVEGNYLNLRGDFSYYRVANYLNASISNTYAGMFKYLPPERYGDQEYKPVLDFVDENGTEYFKVQTGRTTQHKYPLNPESYPYFGLPRLIIVSKVTSCGRGCFAPMEYRDERPSLYPNIYTGYYPYQITKDLMHGELYTYNCASTPYASVRFVCWDGVLIKLDPNEICGLHCDVNNIEQLWDGAGLTAKPDFNTTIQLMWPFATTTTTTQAPTTPPPQLLLGQTLPPVVVSDVVTTTPDPLVIAEHIDFYSKQNFTGFTLLHRETKTYPCFNNFSSTDLFSENPILECFNGQVRFGGYGTPCGRNCKSEGFRFVVGRLAEDYDSYVRGFDDASKHLSIDGDGNIFIEFFHGDQPTAARQSKDLVWDPNEHPWHVPLGLDAHYYTGAPVVRKLLELGITDETISNVYETKNAPAFDALEIINKDAPSKNNEASASYGKALRSYSNAFDSSNSFSIPTDVKIVTRDAERKLLIPEDVDATNKREEVDDLYSGNKDDILQVAIDMGIKMRNKHGQMVSPITVAHIFPPEIANRFPQGYKIMVGERSGMQGGMRNARAVSRKDIGSSRWLQTDNKITYNPVRVPGFDPFDEREPTTSLMRNGQHFDVDCEDMIDLTSEGGVHFFQGRVKWHCNDGVTSVIATCKRRCPEVGYLKVVQGTLELKIDEDLAKFHDHDTIIHEKCENVNSYGTGPGIFRKCFDSKIIVNKNLTHCNINCPNFGYTENLVYVETGKLMQFYTTETFKCASVDNKLKRLERSEGTYDVYCNNGIPEVSNFGCMKHCLPSDNVNDEFRHPYILHDTFAPGECLSDNSTVHIGCFDGFASIVLGECGEMCPGSTIKLTELDPPQTYPDVLHRESVVVNCTGNSFGTATIVCLNGKATLADVNCNSYCPIAYGLSSTSHTDPLTQSDFEPTNYVPIDTSFRLKPDEVAAFPCGGGEAVVRCAKGGYPLVTAVFSMTCGIPIHLCGCCALESAANLLSGTERKYTRNTLLWLTFLLVIHMLFLFGT